MATQGQPSTVQSKEAPLTGHSRHTVLYTTPTVLTQLAWAVYNKEQLVVSNHGNQAALLTHCHCDAVL